MFVLGLDTATFTSSVAVIEIADNQPARRCAARHADTPLLSDVLLSMVDEAITAAGITARDLGAIAVGAGPGSFTGLRIGLATAKGLAFALDRPLWLASSLAAMAWPAHHVGGLVVSTLDARRGEIYAGCYRMVDGKLTVVGDEYVISPSELAAIVTSASDDDHENITVVGDGLIAYPELAQLARGPVVDAPPSTITPSAEAVAWLAAAGDRVDHLVAGVPTYVRRPEVEVQYPDGVPGALRRH